ncbi:hypothetical protein F1559_000441 [Cyanidiococcus yangmingshanensis]|uniref:Phosphoglycerate mutase n=1 Tax=Cyanidiococcus yangmingshanensis TaxID=2690220 RepID=A0A7J7IHQ1_9RHOD|nr:hypothetical protein F1559_000441 [Cyanidiococcus yangmingshanensis]
MFVLSLTGATLLVRHGETDWNRSGRSQGQLDESRLTARGYEQAQRTAQWLCSSAADQIHTIAVSTLQRARESAYHIEKEDASASKWRRWYTELLWEVHVPWQGEQKLDLDLRYPEGLPQISSGTGPLPAPGGTLQSRGAVLDGEERILCPRLRSGLWSLTSRRFVPC